MGSSTELGYENVRQGALQDLADGEPAAAFSKFRSVLEFPASEFDRKKWRDAMEIFARIAEALKKPEVAKLARDASRAPEEPMPQHALGSALLSERLPAIAATALHRARMLAKDSERVTHAYVLALGSIMRHAEAREALRQSPQVLAKSVRCRALLALSTVMTGDLEEARKVHAALPADAASVPEVHMVAGMLARAEAVRSEVRLDRTNLRGWHFVINGSVLLHCSPFSGMNGRYIWLQDTPGRVLDGVRRLSLSLETWGMKVPRVFVLPDRDSAILAHAASSVLNSPAERWPQGGSSSPGLIAVYDLATLRSSMRAEIGVHRPGQILWVHASCWMTDVFYTGDFTTLLHQTNTSPFRSRAVVDLERDTRKIAAEVTDAGPESSMLEDFPALIALLKATRRVTGAHAGGAFLTSGPRRPQLAGSPVPRS